MALNLKHCERNYVNAALTVIATPAAKSQMLHKVRLLAELLDITDPSERWEKIADPDEHELRRTLAIRALYISAVALADKPEGEALYERLFKPGA